MENEKDWREVSDLFLQETIHLPRQQKWREKMNEERKMILEMVKDGTVSIEEGEKLLRALPEEEEKAGMPEPYKKRGIEPKRLRILVTKNDRVITNIKVPFSLIRLGLKLGKTFSGFGHKYADDPTAVQAMETLKDVDIDELLDSLSDGDITLPYTMVDAEDMEKGEHVTIILE